MKEREQGYGTRKAESKALLTIVIQSRLTARLRHMLRSAIVHTFIAHGDNYV